jgi:hypothetical protein
LPSAVEPGAQARELVLPHADVGCRQVVADHGEVQVPALGPPVGPLDPSGHDVRIAWLDDARGLQPVQAGPHRPLRQAGVADQRGHRRERPGAVRAGVVGQADEHELARAGWLAAAVGRDRGQVQRPGDRLDAHRAPPGRREAPPPAAQPVVSLLVSFIPVRSRSPANADRLSAQVGYTPHRWWMILRSPRKRVRGNPSVGSNPTSTATVRRAGHKWAGARARSRSRHGQR